MHARKHPSFRTKRTKTERATQKKEKKERITIQKKKHNTMYRHGYKMTKITHTIHTIIEYVPSTSTQDRPNRGVGKFGYVVQCFVTGQKPSTLTVGTFTATAADANEGKSNDDGDDDDDDDDLTPLLSLLTPPSPPPPLPPPLFAPPLRMALLPPWFQRYPPTTTMMPLHVVQPMLSRVGMSLATTPHVCSATLYSSTVDIAPFRVAPCPPRA